MTETPTKTVLPLQISALVLNFGLVIFLGGFRFFGENAIVHRAEWWIADLALAAVFALPGTVGLIALRRPTLLLAAGILSLVLGLGMLLSIVTLPLVVPGILYLVAYRKSGDRSGSLALATLLLLLAGVGALALIVFAPGKIVCWQKTAYKDGRIVLVRDMDSERTSTAGHFSGRSGPPRADVISEESGCTDGGIRPPVSLAALGLLSFGALAGWRLSKR